MVNMNAILKIDGVSYLLPDREGAEAYLELVSVLNRSSKIEYDFKTSGYRVIAKPVRVDLTLNNEPIEPPIEEDNQEDAANETG